MELNYYVADSFSPELYIKLARAGFISTTLKSLDDYIILLPEIQFSYAVLDFEDLHISKKVSKLLKKDTYVFDINKKTTEVLEKIDKFHKESWLETNYKNMLLTIQEQNNENFELLSFELSCKETNKLIAGEIGYKIGKTYTSLSGFCSKEKIYNNYGTLQLVLLSKYLEKNSYDFWNLGHASLQYKIELGAKVYTRDEFLKRWKTSIIK